MEDKAKDLKELAGSWGAPTHEAGRTRRHFLKIAGSATVLGASLAVFPLDLAGRTAAAATGDFLVTSGFPANGLYTSPVQMAADTFNAIGPYWEVNNGDGEQLRVSVRVSPDGINFSGWQDVGSETHEGKTAPQGRFFGRPQFNDGRYVQFQLQIPAGVSVKLVGLSFIYSQAGPIPPQVPPVSNLSGTPTKPYIISRADWGANEGLRYSGGAEIWPREYQKPRAMIVHHSETPNTYGSNPASEVRGIYYYHAVTKGWGDIGYNFLIDWKGNIYEGRNGGEDVIGGHAYPFNPGTVGVCMLGSFKTVSPPQALLDSLVKLLAWKAASKGINPTAKIWMIDRTISTISAHRDVNDTTCPGDAGYKSLSNTRQRVADLVANGTPGGDVNVALKSVVFSPTSLKLNDLLKVEAVITNTGTAPIESQEPAPGYTYEEGQTFDTQGLEKLSGKFRFAVEYTDNQGVSHPYRWGFGKTLQPGETVTVTGFIKMKQARQIDMYGGIVEEFVKYWQDNVGTTRIQTGGGGGGGGNPTDRVPSRAADPNIIYFPETGHNLGYGFRRYWEQNGGLAIFGYPLTDEFEEASPTEAGKRYTVQYFQRNRFEYHPEFKGTKFEVLLGLLGVQLTSDRFFFKAPAIANTPSKVYFPETKHTLGGSFYRYWNSKGGLPLFGYPISEEFLERNPDDGKTYTVQYFERNRFEYHPEKVGTQFEVLLGLLGTELCRRKGWLK